jgi:putative SOS response-associated peptidase YedK
MPVILPRDAYELWLNPANQDVQDMLRPYPAELLFARKVSTYVSKSANVGPECIEEV